MSAPALLDLNDTAVQLWHGEAALQSPGYALLDGTQYTFGGAARSAARLRPRDINTRYWWQLNTEKLQPALGPARHTADLVHAHLLDIHQRGGEPSEVILAVPGSMAREQLALLLGIIGQCPFTAVGLVNRSVLLGSAQLAKEPIAGSLYHLEIQLHQAVITQMGINAGQLELQQTTPLPGCGLLQLQERVIELVAAAFVRQTRFDPRRKADSEQQLYDALPAVLRSLKTSSEANVEVMSYRARVNRAELRTASEILLGGAPEGMNALRPQDRIIIDPVAALLPGLVEKFPRAIMLDNENLPAALKLHREFLLGAQGSPGEDTLPFITSLPCPGRSHFITDEAAPQPVPVVGPVTVAADQPEAEPKRAKPTHLLIDALASALLPTGTPLARGWELFCQNDSWQLRGGEHIQVNNIDYMLGQPLFCGDRIRLDKNATEGEFSALLIAIRQV